MRGKPWLFLLVLWIALGAAYSSVWTADFVNWDDNRFIVDNPHFQAGGWQFVSAAFSPEISAQQFQAYQPLHLLSYLPDRYLWPSWPGGFHLINLALFLGLGAVIFGLARRIVQAPGPALLACAVVLLHPTCVEAVAWVTARKDVLSALLFFVALTLDDRRWSQPSEEPFWRKAWPGLIVFAGALLTKSAAVCYPLVLVAWLRWIRGTSWRSAIVAAVPHAILATIAAIAVFSIWRSTELIAQTRPAPVWLDVPASLAVFVRHILWPFDLAAIYHPEQPLYAVGGGAVIAAAAAVAVAWRKLPQTAKYAILAPLAALLPVANIVSMQFRYGDRYGFLAWLSCIVPLALAIRWLLARWESRAIRSLIAVALAGLCLASAGFTFGQAGVWSSSSTLWAKTVASEPRAYMARLKYGETLRETGEWQSAASQYQAAIRLEPQRILAYVGLFFLYAKQAESAGELASGTADRWLRAAGRAVRSAASLQGFRRDVLSAGCVRCDRILLLWQLRRWPVDDATLKAAAKQALAAGQRDMAMVYLSEVQDQGQADFQALLKSARQAQP